ncbi:MAG: mechanosensitive ion channel family protein [Acidimicrobiaceae bacterium]|nr:mechanosensitive ion channel family protein [Acidimicrobiaceae bacterium]
MTEGERQHKVRNYGPWLTALLVLVIGGFLLSILTDNYTQLSISVSVMHLLRGLIILVIGLALSRIIKEHLLRKNFDSMSARQRTVAGFGTQLFLYLGLALAVLAALGVGLSSVIFGGAFLTVLIGLAGQSMFTNILGGIWLVLFQPFQVGDAVSFITWQYPILMPSFPHEALKPVYNGRIIDINLMYTSLLTDDGESMVVPNGILAQSAITNRTKTQSRRTRIRCEVPISIDPKDFAKELSGLLDDSSCQIEMTDVSLASYFMRVTLWSQGTDDEKRDEILSSAWKVITRLAPRES